MVHADRRPFAASFSMSAPLLPALICPSCRTRLRVTRERAGIAQPCPECGQSLLVSRDLLQVLLVPPIAAVPSRQPRRQRWLIAAGCMATVVVLASWPRERVIERTKPQAEITPEPQNSKPVHRPSDVKPQPVAKVAADQTRPAAPHQPQNVDPLLRRPPVSQPHLVGMEPPPEPEMRTPALVQDPAVIPVNAEQPLSKTSTPPTPAPRELIDRALRQRFVSFQTSGKTPLRQLVRELNEMANGFIVVSPNVTSETLNKTVALSLRETSLLDVLNAVARVTDLKIVVAEERIELGP